MWYLYSWDVHPPRTLRQPLLHLSAGSEHGSRSVTVPSSSLVAASLFAQGLVMVLAKTAFKNIHSMLNFKDKNTSDGTQKLREVFSLEQSPYLLLAQMGKLWAGERETQGKFTKHLWQFYSCYFSAKTLHLIHQQPRIRFNQLCWNRC